MFLLIIMKRKPRPPKNNENSTPQNLPQNNVPIIHGWPGCQMHNMTPNLHCPQLQGTQRLGTPNNGCDRGWFVFGYLSLIHLYSVFFFCMPTLVCLCWFCVADRFEGQNPNITKRQVEFHSAGRTEEVCKPPPDFLASSWRKPTNLDPAYNDQYSKQIQPASNQPNVQPHEDVVQLAQPRGPVGVVQTSGESSDAHPIINRLVVVAGAHHG